MGWHRRWQDAIEISDLIVDVDAATGERRPVLAAQAIEIARRSDDTDAMRQIAAIPCIDGVLDPAVVDDLLIASHAELSRLGQELAQPFRLREMINTVASALRATGYDDPIRVIDLGCGVGYSVRWLARHGGLVPGVEIAGCDLNPALVDEARRLATADGLACSFVTGNALHRSTRATVVVSSGVLHHFRGPALVELFAHHDPETVRAFIHHDITPTRPALRWLGAWTFHRARMRRPMSRHDGVVSAMRAHSDQTLVQAAHDGAPWAEVGIYEPVGSRSPLVDVLRPVVGVRPEVLDPFLDALGHRRHLFVSRNELAR